MELNRNDLTPFSALEGTTIEQLIPLLTLFNSVNEKEK